MRHNWHTALCKCAGLEWTESGLRSCTAQQQPLPVQVQKVRPRSSPTNLNSYVSQGLRWLVYSPSWEALHQITYPPPDLPTLFFNYSIRPVGVRKILVEKETSDKKQQQLQVSVIEIQVQNWSDVSWSSYYINWKSIAKDFQVFIVQS